MNENNLQEAFQELSKAKEAYQKKDYLTARKHAHKAAQLNPGLEEAWLILAALGDGKARIAYLEKALEINPASERARKGLEWAKQKELKQLISDTQEIKPAHSEKSIGTEEPPHFQSTEINFESQNKESSLSQTKKPKSSMLIPALIMFAMLSLLLIAWLGSPTGWVVFARSHSGPRPTDVLFKPTLTATNTVTPSPTATFTPTPTVTATPTPTNTPTITGTPTNTSTAVPQTYSGGYPDPAIPPAVSSLPDGVEEDERWIDVNLSSQSVYAYEGDELVRSFIASTGTAAHPTVTGQFRIYVKYTSAPMRGPGYYLPGVPYIMYFYKGYGLHGTYWHNNFGTPMSHGCINLITEEAEWLFNWASVGTLVNIHY